MIKGNTYFIHTNTGTTSKKALPVAKRLQTTTVIDVVGTWGADNRRLYPHLGFPFARNNQSINRIDNSLKFTNTIIFYLFKNKTKKKKNSNNKKSQRLYIFKFRRKISVTLLNSFLKHYSFLRINTAFCSSTLLSYIFQTIR